MGNVEKRNANLKAIGQLGGEKEQTVGNSGRREENRRGTKKSFWQPFETFFFRSRFLVYVCCVVNVQKCCDVKCRKEDIRKCIYEVDV